MLKEFFIKNSINFTENESMKNHTTFKVGGMANFVVYPNSKEQLKQLILFLNKENIKHFYLGKGSNVIFKDSIFEGVVIKSSNFTDLKIEKDTATVGSGYQLTLFCKELLDNSLSGLEFCYGIPGNIGGSLYMNAGAYGGEISDCLQSIECMDSKGNIKVITKEQARFSYRHSIFQEENLFIINATFKLKTADKSTMKKFMQDIMNKRIDKQPLDKPSAGSSFKRPKGYFAAALIDECGLKGLTVGGAQVSEKHAGFIVNIGGATCEDIITLAKKVEDIVYEKTGVMIEKEMIIV